MKTKAKDPLPKTIGKWETPIPFEENFKWAKSITFCAASFTTWIEDSLPIVKSMSPMSKDKAKTHGTLLGEKVFYLRSLPMWHYASWYFLGPLRPTRTGLEIYKGRTQGMAYFDDVVNIPVLANEKMDPWMSLTPNEILTLRGSIRRAKGNVGIAGLGLGWVARKVLQRPAVTHLTIYEKDKSVVEFFGNSLVTDFGDRVTIVHGDAYEADWSQFDVSLWDIWADYADASWDKRYKEIKQAIQSNNKVCIAWGVGAN